MAIQQLSSIKQSRLARTNQQLAMELDLLWSEANKLKAKEGAKRLEYVCEHYDQLTPETTYRWIDPIGFQHEVEDSLVHRVAVWHTIRNCASVLPLIFTGISLYYALTAYQQDTYQGDAGKPFLQLWQEGFHGGTILTPSTTVAIDIVLLIFFVILIGVASSLDSRAYRRSTAFAQKLQVTTERLMNNVANNQTIHVDQLAITNVANAVQQVVNVAMRANQQLIRDTMEASQQVTTTAEKSINQAVQQSQISITASNERVENLFNRKITPLLDRFDTNVQALQGEIRNYQKRLDDLTDASQKLAGVSGQLAVNATAYKQVEQEINKNIAALNSTQNNLLPQIGAVLQGITGAAKDMNEAAIHLSTATEDVKKVATQLDSGIQRTLGTMTTEVKDAMGIITTEVTEATTTMSSRVQQTVNAMSMGVKAGWEELAVLGDQLSDLTNAIKQLASVSSHLEEALELPSQLLAEGGQEESAFHLHAESPFGGETVAGRREMEVHRISDRLSEKARLGKDVVGPDDIKLLSLFAIARTTLEDDDRALVRKFYSVEAGISQSKPENFEGEPFDLPVPNTAKLIPFDILIHASENIELMTEWQQRLRYDPRNPEPQLVEFAFQVIVPGHNTLVVDFYYERRWLRTVRFEFDAVEQSQLTAISSEG